MRIASLLVITFLPSSLMAQSITYDDLLNVTAKKIRHGSAVPSACAPGQVFQDADGVNYGCGAGLTFVAPTAASAATLATPRAIYGNNFDGSAALTQIIASTFGGTGNGFFKVAGPATSEKTYTFPNASSTMLYSGGDAGTPSALVATNLTGNAAGLTAGIASLAAVVTVELELFPAGTVNATGDGKAYFIIPASMNGMNLTAVSARVYTAGTTGTVNVDVARCAAAATGNVCSGTVSDMLSTNVTIDSAENSTATAAAAAVIDTGNDDVATGQVIRLDVDAVHTTPAQGLLIALTFSLP